jgi:hypothetical protein
MSNSCFSFLCATAPSNEAFTSLRERVEEAGDYGVISALHPAWIGERSGELHTATFHDETVSIEIAIDTTAVPPTHILDYLRNQGWMNVYMLFVDNIHNYIGWYDMTMSNLENIVMLSFSPLVQILRDQGEAVLRQTLEQRTQNPEYLSFLMETIGNEI